jgi:hypothetical protein
MTLVVLADLTAGMVVAKPVQTDAGRIVVGEGVALTERHIQGLRMWNIAAVDVLDQAADAGAVVSTSPPLTSEAEAALRSRFASLDLSDPFVRELFDVCVQRGSRQ